MTVSSNDRRWGPVSGDGSTVDFTTDFPIATSTDAIVEVRDTATGIVTTKTITTDYTIISISASGFTIRFVTPPSATEKVIARSAEPITQEVDFTSTSAFPAEANEGALDKHARIMQDLKEQVSRVALLSAFDSTPQQLVIPPRTGNEGKALVLANDHTLGWGTEVASLVEGVDYLTAAVIRGNFVYHNFNYAALRAESWDAATAPATVRISCRSNLGDGGGGVFAFDSSDTTSVDDAALILVTASGRRYKRVIEDDCFCAAWWGADYDALQAAVDATVAANFALFVNPGAYAFDAADSLSITGACEIRGVGPATILRASADRSIPVVSITGNNVTLKQLRVETTFAGTPTVLQANAGVVADTVEDVLLKDLEIEGRFYVGAMYKDVTRPKGRGLYIRGARNRQLYIYENCVDVAMSDITLDGRDSGGSDYADYCFNINPAGTDTPRSMTINGVTCRGHKFHGFSIAEDWEEVSISDVVVTTTTTTAVGFLLQAANGKRGRKWNVSNISCTGGLPIYVTGCDNINLANLMADAGDSASGNILINDCHDIEGSNWQAKDGAGPGVQIIGTTSGACTDVNVTGLTTEGNAGAGVLVAGSVANGAQDINLTAINSHDNGTYGAQASSNTDRVKFFGGSMHDNASGNVLNASVDGQTVIDFTFEQGTFTPTLTFATPGDLSTAYAAQVGEYERVGDRIHFSLQVAASTFTFTGAASGNLRIGGLPYAAKTPVYDRMLVHINTAHTWPASVTAVTALAVAGEQYLELRGIGSGITPAAFTTAHIASGSNPNITIHGSYRV